VSVTLDGQALFDEQNLQVTVGSHARRSIERNVCGLDGMLSVDLGRQARRIRQTGTLRAVSEAAMRRRIDNITGFIDGDAHVLVTADGGRYANVRMDSFKELGKSAGGPGLVIEYAIVYTQLEA
jgi:hypothetical protein